MASEKPVTADAEYWLEEAARLKAELDATEASRLGAIVVQDELRDERDETKAALTGGRKKAIEQRDKAEQERDAWRKRAEENAVAIEAVARERDEARERVKLLEGMEGEEYKRANRLSARLASLEGALRAIADNAVTLLHCQSVARAALAEPTATENVEGDGEG